MGPGLAPRTPFKQKPAQASMEQVLLHWLAKIMFEKNLEKKEKTKKENFV